MPIYGPKRWRNIPLNEYYILNFIKIGDNILLVQNEGDLTHFDSRNYFRIREDIIQEAFGKRAFVEIRSHDLLRGRITRDERKRQVDFLLKEKERLLGLFFYNSSFYTRALVTASAATLKSPYSVKSVATYSEAIIQSLNIIRNYQENEYIYDLDNFETRSDWFFQSQESGFSLSFKCIPSKVIYSEQSGEPNLDDIPKIEELYRKVFSFGHFRNNPYIKISNYLGITGSSRKIRKSIVSLLNRLHKEYQNAPEVTYICGATNQVMAALLFIKPFIRTNIQFADTVEHAFSRLRERLQSKVKNNKENEQLLVSDEDIDKIINYVGEIAWSNKISEKDEIQLKNRHLQKIIDALVLVKDDFNSLIKIREDREKQIQRELDKRKTEISKAKAIQQILVQKKLPVIKHHSFASTFIPSDELGGDFIQIKETEDGKIYMILADCNGHGLEASMYATLLKAICDRYLDWLALGVHPEKFISKVNQDITSYIIDAQYPVLFVGILDGNEFYYANANGELPYLLRDNKVSKLPPARGFHLGYEKDIVYQRQKLSLKDDDILILYSDALIEIPGGRWSKFELENLEQLLEIKGANLHERQDILLQEIADQSPGRSLNDDFSLVMLQYQTDRKESYTLNEMSQLVLLKRKVDHVLNYFNYQWEDREKIIICLNEIVINALHHGHKDDSSKTVKIQLHCNAKTTQLTIQDEGPGFNPEAIQHPGNLDYLMQMESENNIESLIHGRGVWLVGIYSDEFHHEDKGRRSIIIKHKTSPEVISQIFN